ncbi:MAG: cell division protein FtsX [Methyloligella sp.]|jgi:cell division transport system permease protein|nr:MAG: cell division protein FtsX [Methyloligella sp.]
MTFQPNNSAPPVTPASKELYSPSRPKERGWGNQHTPIVQAKSVTGSSLVVVISIMCFLASLTAGGVYLINQSAAAWTDNIASEVTVQISINRTENIEDKLSKISFFLTNQPGITGVRPLPLDESADLLEPWLGDGANLKDLPIPRLIAVELDRESKPNLDKLRSDIKKNFKNATLDDHRRWQSQIQTVTRSMALAGLAVLILVGLATTAVIVSATRSAMSSNREIVEVLHFVGATDRFIAREFERHFLSLGIRSGLVGATGSLIVFIFMPFFMRVLGGSNMTSAEVRRLLGTAALDLPGFILLGIVVVVIAALCMLTTRYGVYRILNSQHH